MLMMGGNAKKIASLIASRVPRDNGMAGENAESFSDRAKEPDDEIDEAKIAAAEDLLAAIKRDDPVAVARALEDAFEIFDGEPHVEGPHIGSED